MIYTYVLVRRGMVFRRIPRDDYKLRLLVDIEIENTGKVPQNLWGYRLVGLSPAILATNHQIHDEAAPILYGHNIFHFGIGAKYFESPTHQDYIEDPDVIRSLRIRRHADIRTCLPSRYNRLICKLDLNIYIFWMRESSDPPYGVNLITERLQDLIEILAPNPPLREVSVLVAKCHHRAPQVDYQRILDPLKLLRGVRNVTLRACENGDYLEELKAIMTSPRSTSMASLQDTSPAVHEV